MNTIVFPRRGDSHGQKQIHSHHHIRFITNYMPSEGDTFLPRIQSVFYAVFDLQKGPKIVYQVPEGLITGSTANQNTNPSVTSSPSPSIAAAILESDVTPSRRSSPSVNSHGGRRASSLNVPSPHQRSSSSSRVLFNFDDISKYVIPPGELCGRLVICATRKYRIIGFPVLLPGNYQRNYFQYNVCFVFERSADLSCYEPIVRKVSRVLTACEVSSLPCITELCVYELVGRIIFSLLSKIIASHACHSRAVIRGSELLF